MKQFELKPWDRQKSYYGKAIVHCHESGWNMLQSYKTVVCGYNEKTGEFIRTWNDYSATTMKHIDSFRRAYGLRGLGKKEWLNLPCEKYNELVYKIENYIRRYGRG